MSIINPIDNHEELALSRLLTQYRDSENIKTIISIHSGQIQEIEDQANKLLTERSLEGSIGFQLDQMGTILNEIREGLDDDDYRIRLKAKIAENVSEGTPEDLISIFKLLLNPERVIYDEIYPAGFELIALGEQDPISSIARIKDALNRAKPAGVELSPLKKSDFIPLFCYAGSLNPDLCGGYRDIEVAKEFSPSFVYRDLEEAVISEGPVFRYAGPVEEGELPTGGYGEGKYGTKQETVIDESNGYGVGLYGTKLETATKEDISNGNFGHYVTLL